MVIEGGTLEAGASVATHPVFLVGTLLFGVALVVGLLYVAEVQEVRIVEPIFGLLPRRLLGVLTIAAATAVVMMTRWGRVSGATPWLATGQLRSASSGWPSALRSGTSSPEADGRADGRTTGTFFPISTPTTAT